MRGLLDSELVVVTGKGGVGASTVAAALGVLAARRGARVAVAETGGRTDTAALLAGHAVERVAIEPGAAMREYLHRRVRSRTLAELLAGSPILAGFVGATPGLADLLTIGKAWELAQRERREPGAAPYDVVVLDAPATGHALGLLSAPALFAETARVGPIHAQAARIDAALRDPAQTAIVAVTRAQETPVNEALELRTGVRERLGRDLDAIVCNAIAADRFSAADARSLAEAPGSAARAARWADARARAQRRELRRLRAGLDAPPLRLPLLADEPLGPDDAATLAARLERIA